MAALAGEIVALPRTTVEEGPVVVKTTVSAIAPARLRNVGKNGRDLRISYNAGDYEDGAQSLVFATGPWPLIESDIPPHAIPRLKGSRSKLGAGAGLGGTGRGALLGPAFGGTNQKRLTTPYGVRDQVWHPGTKGQHPWARGVETAVPLVARLFETEVSRVIVRSF